MKKVILICALVISYGFQQPKSLPFNFIAGIGINAKIISTDALGNLYIVSQTNQLNKYNRNGKQLSTLNYSYAGNITHVDASNMLEVYVFYKELNRVIFLDNNLAYRGEIDLNKAGIIQAGAIARSYDNNLWVYDMGDLQLKKVKKNGDVEQTSGNIRQYVEGNAAINYLYENNNRVFMVDSVNGILLFDVFATYLKTIPVKRTSEIKVLNDYFFYVQDNILNRYNWALSQAVSFELPDTVGLKKMSIEKERIYLLKQDTVYIYAY